MWWAWRHATLGPHALAVRSARHPFVSTRRCCCRAAGTTTVNRRARVREGHQDIARASSAAAVRAARDASHARTLLRRAATVQAVAMAAAAARLGHSCTRCASRDGMHAWIYAPLKAVSRTAACDALSYRSQQNCSYFRRAGEILVERSQALVSGPSRRRDPIVGLVRYAVGLGSQLSEP